MKSCRGTLQWNVHTTDMLPDVTQYEKQGTTYEGFLPKWLNLNLHKP